MTIKPELVEQYNKYKALNSKDPYSAGIVKWGEDVMNEVETNNTSFEEAVRKTDDGYTGFMYDCMIQALSNFWVRGDELLKWHNRKYIKDEAAADAKSAAGKQISTTIMTIG